MGNGCARRPITPRTYAGALGCAALTCAASSPLSPPARSPSDDLRRLAASVCGGVRTESLVWTEMFSKLPRGLALGREFADTVFADPGVDPACATGGELGFEGGVGGSRLPPALLLRCVLHGPPSSPSLSDDSVMVLAAPRRRWTSSSVGDVAVIGEVRCTPPDVDGTTATHGDASSMVGRRGGRGGLRP